MAQTTTQLSMSNCDIEVSADNAVWVDISGSANKVAPSGQSRMNGAAFVFDGDTGLITWGKREPMDIVISALYTETAAEAFETLRAWHETADGQKVYVRYSLNGAQGEKLYTSGKGIISELKYPEMDASSGDAIPIEVTIVVPNLVQSTIA